MSAFKLYPTEQRWWSNSDYQAVLDVMARLTPSRVLEFGPGSSTLALIEGGAEHIDSCEDDPKWMKVYQERLVKRFPEIVRLHPYTWADPLSIPALDANVYDLALIDGPLGTERRIVVLAYCMERCAAVLMPTETWKTRGLQPQIVAFARERKARLELFETGPLSGGFALVQSC